LGRRDSRANLAEKQELGSCPPDVQQAHTGNN
jgi:hypothetical protein